MKAKLSTLRLRYIRIIIPLLAFALVAVFGFSLITQNISDSNVKQSKASTQEPADINNDNKVDIFDLSTLLGNWNKTGTTTSDVNSDNIVNIFDLSMLLSKWGPVAVATPTVTPTPTATTAYARGLTWYQQNTGVPAGTALTASGDITINTDGATISDKDINGDVHINAKNVTLKNSRVKGTIYIDHGEPTYNTIIDHVEIDLSGIAIDPSGNSNKLGAAAGWGTTIKYSKIHGMAQGIVFSGYLIAEDNYIYGIRSNGQHAECILSNGDPTIEAGNSVVRRNWLDADGTNAVGYVSSAMSMYGDWGQIKNVVVDGNFFSGVGYLLYPGATKLKPYPWPYNVAVTNNTFDITHGAYGPVYPSKLDALSESLWANNKLTSGASVPAPVGNN